MTIAETILGGLAISLGSISVTHLMSSKNKIDRESCKSIRQDCKENRTLAEKNIIEKIDNLHCAVEKIDDTLNKIISNKLLGI